MIYKLLKSISLKSVTRFKSQLNTSVMASNDNNNHNYQVADSSEQELQGGHPNMRTGRLGVSGFNLRI